MNIDDLINIGLGLLVFVGVGITVYKMYFTKKKAKK